MILFADNLRKEDLKFEPYEPCPCLSGKKFKFCCYQKARNFKQKSLSELNYSESRIQYEMSKLWDETDFKTCFGFKKEECGDLIKSAHSIQNNRILNRISDENHVYQISHRISKDEGITTEFKRISKNKASTFFGFCDFHDTELFKPIELKDYENEEIQNFLFAFRALSIEMHKKIRRLESLRNISKKYPNKLIDPFFVYNFKQAELDIRDFKSDYEKFKRGYIENNFSNIKTLFRKLPFEINFAVSTSFAVNEDLNGNTLNEIHNIDKNLVLPSIYLNIYPIEGGTNIIISYFLDNDDVYGEYFNQLEHLNDKEFVEYLNFLIIEYTENIFFRPNFIENLNEEQKYSLLKSFESSFFPLEKFELLYEDNYYNFDLFSRDTQ
ncbi:SEC-C domain-containing protein [Bacillus spizizenii]|nr:SEC-C domain-containing protein [Bacillus spizizenii]MCY9306883.1 SEC-C domain-containing protein [Bacillus spizizenii]MCY9443213.1 SEC-C domain-containing protein [Bacillus spizizenii]MEC0548394.1 SEC-C domain-containing protein [Bacillus spizizenii]